MRLEWSQNWRYRSRTFIYCWTSNRPAWSKIEGRLAHVKKVLKFINQKSSKFSWVVSQTRVLQRSNPRKTFHREFIDMCRRVSSSRWPPEPSNAPPTNILLPLFPWVLQNNMWLSPPFSFCSLINWYQTLNCYVCVWGYFSHFTLVQNVLTVCTSLFSMRL